MQVVFVSLLILAYQPAADPTFFSYNSPQCVGERLAEFNPLPIIVRTQHPPCPWSSDDAAQVEVGRYLSNYSYWNYERTTNLELAASKIDGVMLLPGEVFSYNETVGERTLETGFKKAKVIAEFGYTDGIGGGVCQPASNLHASAVMAGLDIEERWRHRFRVKYMPPGLDATVDYGKKDLKIRNNTLFPVVFQMGRLEDGELLTRVLSPTRIFRVKFKYDLVKETLSSTVRFKREEEPKDKVEYYGRPGFEIEKHLYRRNLATNKLERIRIPNDIYEPSPWTLRVKEYPTSKRVEYGLSKKQINAMLKGTRYTVDMARFSDVAQNDGKYLERSYVPRKKMRVYQRFSEIEKYVDLASAVAPELRDN